MIQAFLDFINWGFDNFSFLFSLILYTILAVALAKSIKKRAKVYYWVFGVISFAYLIPFLCRMCGFPLPFNLGTIPLLGLSMDELSHASWFIHPVIVIIMYMGAFSPKIKWVGSLMSIRKELSIIVGFPVLAHGMKRVLVSFPSGWSYFFSHEEYMLSRAGQRVTSQLGAGITNFVFVLGLVMFILFLVLWITSFDGVRKKMSAKSWKSVQKWSYGLYAMLFIHAVGLQLGGLISYNARVAQQAAQAQEVVVEQPQVAVERPARPEQAEGTERPQRSGSEQTERPATQSDSERPSQTQQGQQGAQGQHSHGQQAQGQQAQGQQQQGPQRSRPFSFEEKVEISQPVKRGVNIVIYCLVYGSYLYLRLRKAREDKAKRAKAAASIKK